jgi:hypothetical protein
MASATALASVPGTRPAAPEARDAGRLQQHVEGPQMAAAVVAAARRSSLPHCASHDHACTRTHSNLCIPSPSVANVRKMLESCDNHERREKNHGKMFPRHAEWLHMADAVIDTFITASLIFITHRPRPGVGMTPRVTSLLGRNVGGVANAMIKAHQ